MDKKEIWISPEPVLELRNISKVYGNGVYANKNICFSVAAGEIHALVGENGAGKSTLMKVLFGMEKPDQGEILVRGKPVVFHSPQEAMALGIGMVHQHFKLVESLTITENVVMGYEPVKRGLIDARAAREKVEAFGKIFDLKEDLGTPIEKLPVGTRQKVEIIKAMYRGARILILDEPTAVLTPQETEELFRQLKELKKEGFTVIFISHKLREVKELSDRISVMRRGELITTKDTAEVSEQEISGLMVGSSYSKELEKKKAQPGEEILRVREVTAEGVNGKNLVDAVSFSVRAGEIVGIAGVEGNGQNELIEMITGLRPVRKGQVFMGEWEVAKASIRERRELGMSYIPSDRMETGLAVTMPIYENLIAVKMENPDLYQRGLLSKRKIQKLSEHLVREYRIKCDSPDTEVQMLSGGNMQKVVVAREFTQNARLIIAEQPTRGIDIGAAGFIHKELLRRRDEGCGVLLVSADLEELYKLSDSILVLYDGSFSAYIKEPESVSEKELGEYMLGVRRQPEEEIKEAYHEKEKSVV